MCRILGHSRAQVKNQRGDCRCKMRMSGLSKVEMSAFIGGRGPHGNGANRLAPTRTGPPTRATRDKAEADHAARIRGRPSNRRLAARLELKILRRVRQRYADFGPTLAAEHLAQEGLAVSRETLSKWMVKASLCCLRAQRVHIPLRTPRFAECGGASQKS